MKVIVDGKEVEIETDIEEGELEFDSFLEKEDSIDLESTVRLTKEDLDERYSMGEENE